MTTNSAGILRSTLGVMLVSLVAHAAELRAGESTSQRIEAAGGELVLDLHLELAGGGWEHGGAESVVLAVALDGRACLDLLVLRSPQHSQVFLGEVTAGPHVVDLRFDTERSPAQRACVTIVKARVDPVADPLVRHAPIVLSRAALTTDRGMARSDALVLVVGERLERAGGSRLRYTGVFTNEDGGTGLQPPLLLAHWGRTTDIEWLFEIDLDQAGEVRAARYHGAGHSSRDWDGAWRGTHALLQVATDNNTVAPAPEASGGALVQALVPVERSQRGGSRERILDEHPWIYALANAEMAREPLLGLAALGLKKLEARADPKTPALSDLRNYLLVDVEARGRARYVFAVRSGGTWYASDHGRTVLGAQREGWGRTAIELPDPSALTRIDALRITAHDLAPGATVTVLSLRGFRLDAAFTPTAPVIEIDQPVQLDAATPTVELLIG